MVHFSRSIFAMLVKIVTNLALNVMLVSPYLLIFSHFAPRIKCVIPQPGKFSRDRIHSRIAIGVDLKYNKIGRDFYFHELILEY